MSIFLVRHGETDLNATRVLQPPDTPLNDRGLAQAGALATRLAGLGIARIVSSDLPRALQTAEAIAAATGAPVETSTLLHERNFGDLRGKAYDSLGFDPMTSSAAPPNGESQAAFEARVARAFARIGKWRAATDGNLVVVTHGLLIRRLLDRHAVRDDGVTAPMHLGNTSLSVLDAAPPFRLGLANCTRHLDAGGLDDRRALSGG